MKTKIIIIIIAIFPLIYGIFSLANIPDQVVVHWNIAGQADRYGSKYIYLTLACLPIIILNIQQLYNKFSKIKQNQQQLNKLINSLVVFFAIISVLLINQATSEQLQIMRGLVVLFGALFIYIGNMMNKLNKNLTFGIRIPATIRNEKVWNRTHYIGGYTFVLCGILTILSTIIFTNPSISLGVMSILLIGSVIYITIYAEILYRKETGHSSLTK